LKSAKNNRDNIYQPGDLVEQWNAVVDSNHCGLPWPVCVDGEYIMGAVCIHQTPFGSILLDAKTGNRLMDDECVLRKGNFAFDYNDRAKLKHETGEHSVDRLVRLTCFWKYHNGHGGEWETSCGARYDADDFGCSTIRKCPKCGRETTTVKPNIEISQKQP
jgi:hypothetical protein